MSIKSRSFVSVAVRPLWNAWMRFGNHNLSLGSFRSNSADDFEKPACYCVEPGSRMGSNRCSHCECEGSP